MDVEELLRQYAAGERNFAAIDLRGADLRGIQLTHSNLEGVNLSSANLSEASLGFVNLNRANLRVPAQKCVLCQSGVRIFSKYSHLGNARFYMAT